MEKKSKEQILAFAKEFADRIYELGWHSLEDVVIRISNITISLDFLVRLTEARSDGCEEEYKKQFRYSDGWYESEDRLEDVIPRVAEDDTIEAVMFCEGNLWETLYYCEAYGRNDEKSRAIYQAFVQTVAEHGMRYEWGNGTIFLVGNKGL